MEILYKGKVRRDGDYTRYYIRLTFTGKEQLVFGECLTLRKAAEKVSFKYNYSNIIEKV